MKENNDKYRNIYNIGNSVNVIKSWQEQGAEIMYFTTVRNFIMEDV